MTANANPAKMKPRILVVDDEADALELAELNLRNAGFAVLLAADGADALKQARQKKPDLIVLDLMLPEMDGLEVCKTLRQDPATAGILILMLTAKAGEIDRVLGLELGADDYVTKPFSPRELILRIKSLLRRGNRTHEPSAVIRAGTLCVDAARHEVTVRGKPVDLTATEFKLLAFLAERRGRVQTRDLLLRDVWGYDNLVDTRTVDTHIRRLREKLGAAADCIDTVRGVGYRLQAD